VLGRHFARVESGRLAAVCHELRELSTLAELVRAELPERDLPSLHWRPADPLAAGILAVLERHDRVSLLAAGVDGAYREEAEEIAELMREATPSGDRCAVVAWTVLRRWTSPEEAGPIDAFLPLGEDISRLAALHAELMERDPELLASVAPSAQALLAAEPRALHVLGLLVEHDPLGFSTAEDAELQYVPDARELAARLVGRPGPQECQVLAWKVLAEPSCGPFGGAVGRYRELGDALARLVRTT